MFEFASGKIAVLEKKVFDKNDLERMLKAPDYQNAFLVLYDTDLEKIVSEEKSIEEILNDDLIQLRKVLEEILEREERKLLWYLFLKFDALNLKILLKGEKISPFDVSIEPFENLKKFVKGYREKDKNEVLKNPFVREMASLALKDLEKIGKGKKEVEELVDFHYFREKLKIASFSSFLTQLTKIEIDLANFKKLFSERNSKIFLEGGYLKKKEIMKILEKKDFEENELSRRFPFLSFKKIVEKEKIPGELEKELKRIFSEFVFQKEKEKGFGEEKVVSYFIKKINAQANIRILLFAKKNNLKISEIENFLLPI